MTPRDPEQNAMLDAVRRLSEPERIKMVLEGDRLVTEAGREALRSALLINGGAAVALLAFLGAVLSKENLGRLGLAMIGPLASFAVGVFFAALGFGVRYLSQEASRLYFEARAKRYQRCAVASTGASLLAFVIGITFVCMAFSEQFAP